MRPLLTLPGLSPLHRLHLRASYVMSQLIKAGSWTAADCWTATHRCLSYALQPHGQHPGCMLTLMITQVDCFCRAHSLASVTGMLISVFCSQVAWAALGWAAWGPSVASTGRRPLSRQQLTEQLRQQPGSLIPSQAPPGRRRRLSALWKMASWLVSATSSRCLVPSSYNICCLFRTGQERPVYPPCTCDISNNV